MKRSVVRAVLAMTSCMMILQAAHAEEEIDTSPPSESLPAIVTFGGRASDSIVEGLVDVLIPFHEGPDLVLFLNPRLSGTDRSEEEANIGVGVRKLLADRNIILGANAYYDSRWTRHDNQFNQFGFGVEMLSEWIDARANFYKPENKSEVIDVEETETSSSRVVSEKWGRPEPRGHDIRQDVSRSIVTTTTRQRFERFEEAMEGFDAEVGILLPFLMDLAETRVFGGYYRFDSKFGDDLEGMKARVEVRALPGLTLDAEYYEDKELHGSDYFIGARVHVPFNIGHLISGRNPFEGAGESFKRGEDRPFRSRMTEMVIRDIKIQQEESGFIENEAARTETSKRSDTRESVAVVKDINFVDQDSTSPIENGTWEHPYTVIQDGVDKSFGRRNVFVLAASGPYEENVVLRDGVKLIGSSIPIRLNGGHWFFVGGLPVVDGMNLGPTITMANQTFVGGFGVLNTDFGNPAIDVTIAGETFDVSRAGIIGINKTDLVVARNIVGGTDIGIALAADNVKDFRVKVKDNFVIGNDSVGIGILGRGASGTFDVDVTGNVSVGNLGPGVFIQAENYNHARANVRDNIIVGNDDIGLGVLLEGWFGVEFVNHDNIVGANLGPGIIFEGFSLDYVHASTRNVITAGNDGPGLEYFMVGLREGVDASFRRVFAFGNNGHGVAAQGFSILGDVDMTMNTVLSFINNGIGVGAAATSIFGDADVRINGVVAAANSELGVGGFAESIFGDASVKLSTILSGGNGFEGVILEGFSVFGDTLLTANNIISVANGGDGLAFFGESILGGVDMHAHRVIAAANVGDGVDFNGFTGLGDLNVIATSIISVGNDDDGVDMDLDSLFGDINIKMRTVVAEGNLGEGLDLDAETIFGGVNVDLARIWANDNDQENIQIDAFTGLGDINIWLRDIQANRSIDEEGIDITAETVRGEIYVGLNNVQANDNDEEGIQTELISDLNEVYVGYRNVEAMNNLGNGIENYVEAGGDIHVRYNMVDVSGNGFSGIEDEMYAGGRIDYVGRWITANGNGINGIDMDLEADDSIFARLINIQANDNGGNGVDATLNTLVGPGNSIMLIRHSEALNNGGIDVFLNTSSQNGSAINVLYFVELDSFALSAAAVNGTASNIILP